MAAGEKSFDDVERTSSDHAPLLEETSHELKSRKFSLLRTLLPWLAHLLVIVLFLCSIGFFYTSSSPSDLECIQRQSLDSPGLGSVVPLQEITFNGTLEVSSPFKGYGPDVDAAWETLVRRNDSKGSSSSIRSSERKANVIAVGPFGISDEQFSKLGRPLIPELARLSGPQGPQIAGMLEVFHQIHCVNFVRMYTYREYYEPKGGFLDSPKFTRVHVDHCLDMLRQKIMCDGDVGLITLNWVTVRKEPWPDFNTKHKCRNFEKIQQWAHEKTAQPQNTKWERPSNIAGLEIPP